MLYCACQGNPEYNKKGNIQFDMPNAYPKIGWTFKPYGLSVIFLLQL